MFCKPNWPTACGSASSESPEISDFHFIQYSYPISSITSYGDRANDYDTVVHYFRAHFMQVHRKNNEKKRVLYTHQTNVVVCSPHWLVGFRHRLYITIRISKPRAVSSQMVGFRTLQWTLQRLITHTQFVIPYSGTTWNLLLWCEIIRQYHHHVTLPCPVNRASLS